MKGFQTFNAPRRRIAVSMPTPLRPTAVLPNKPSLAATATSAFSTSTSLQARKKKGGEKRDSRIKQIRYHLFHPLNPRPLRLSRLRALRHWTIHRAWQLFKSKQRQAEELQLQKQYQSMYNACEALRLLGEDGLAVQDSAYQSHGSQMQGEVLRPPGARDPVSRTYLRRKDGSLYAADLMSEEERAKEAKGKGRGKPKEVEEVTVDIAAAAEQQQDVGRLYRIAMEKKGVFQGVPIEYARIQTDTPPRNGWDHGWKKPTAIVR